MRISWIARSIVVACTGALLGCVDTPVEVATDPVFPNPLIAELARRGFRVDMVKDLGSSFLVEGDILIAKTDLMTPDQGPSKQYYTTNVVWSANVASIVVNISALDTLWKIAARDAMAEWNAVTYGSRINFSEGISGADITMTMASLTFFNCFDGIVAQASFPSSGNPGPTVQVNSSFTSCSWLDATLKKWNLAHELGHTIGFRHSNWIGNGESSSPVGAWHIPGTPTSGNDGGSVMNGSSATSLTGFSDYDKTAAVYLYPVPGPTSLAISYPGGTPYLTWNSVANASSYRIRLRQDEQWLWDGAQDLYETWETSGTTSNTYFSDGSRSNTGYTWCYYSRPWIPEELYRTVQGYWVDAVFAFGYSQASGVLATVARSENYSQAADYCV